MVKRSRSDKEARFNIPTPREIVKELDKHIIGQDEAKKAVAIALRNRGRRRLLTDDLKEEVAPKNIIMIGPTGVGKTEIAKRLSNLAGAPFIKVEATKYTEIGYVGRDVEAMIRDLTNISVNQEKKLMQDAVEIKAVQLAEERLLNLLYPVEEPVKKRIQQLGENVPDNEKSLKDVEVERKGKTREKLRERLSKKELEDKYVEISVKETSFPMVDILGGMNIEDMDFMLPGISNMMPKKQKSKKVPIKEARKILISQESEKLIDMDKVIILAIKK
ncbi:MAG: AAA family ATPase, partial [Spirochaetes bacterium]|nr:AAA family ATPase [Spirochaetota bacterium]